MSNVFYKFRSHRSSEDLARTLSIITDGQIYAPSLKKLNDPSEGFFLKVHGCEADIETQRAIDNLRVVSLCRLYSRPAGDTCSKCGENDRGNGSIGFYLEEHLTVGLDVPNYYAEENTILLCPNCHRKEHLPSKLDDVTS